ncbi:MAG TPA: macro domain-containing protein [Bryobacteraceae bacterium]|nr:macro domain-containing protein [Bryobacteraceae bacterium]
MIEFKQGDILEANAEALVNTVNCVGVMGRGIALQFKEAFPENFKAYAVACKRHELEPGKMFVFEWNQLRNPKFIINFPTKRHWRGQSRIGDIELGLESLVKEIRERRIGSIAIPPLGSGLGGLDWSEVRPRIEKALTPLKDVSITVFEPLPDVRKERKAGKVPEMTAGRAALIGLMSRYLAGLLDPCLTLLEVHKLMYFMQEAGEPLRLTYVAGPYGPYADNLRHVLRKIDGYFVSGYADGGDFPDKALSLVPGATEDADGFLLNHPPTRRRFERVADLVDGFETPFGLELLSTVHWVYAHDHVTDAAEIVSKVYSWNDRKRQFSPRQILLARDVLAKKGWTANPHSLASNEAGS